MQKPKHLEIIITPDRLQPLADRLASEDVVAFDLEADSMHHYQEKVCLLQVATVSETAIVDPLVVPDFSPLAPVLANPDIRKVFHGADYDIRSLHRDFGLQVVNLFDTMIACQFLGEKEVGLAAVLRKRFGVELDKRFQKADWSRRPLRQEMIEYAVEDTSLLVELYRQLAAELAACGRLSWVEEESALVSRVRFAVRAKEPLFMRVKGYARMKPRELAILEELLVYRDERAKGGDVPPFKIIGADPLMVIAQRHPKTLEELAKVPGMSGKLVDRYGKGLLQALARGMAVPEDRLPVVRQVRKPKRAPEMEARLARLKEWREQKARHLGMEPGIMVSNSILEALAELAPREQSRFSEVPAMREWQKAEFGVELLSLLR